MPLSVEQVSTVMPCGLIWNMKVANGLSANSRAVPNGGPPRGAQPGIGGAAHWEPTEVTSSLPSPTTTIHDPPPPLSRARHFPQPLLPRGGGGGGKLSLSRLLLPRPRALPFPLGAGGKCTTGMEGRLEEV